MIDDRERHCPRSPSDRQGAGGGMSGFELLRCEDCGHEHVRPCSTRHTLPCVRCGGRKAAFELVAGCRLEERDDRRASA